MLTAQLSALLAVAVEAAERAESAPAGAGDEDEGVEAALRGLDWEEWVAVGDPVAVAPPAVSPRAAEQEAAAREGAAGNALHRAVVSRLEQGGAFSLASGSRRSLHPVAALLGGARRLLDTLVPQRLAVDEREDPLRRRLQRRPNYEFVSFDAVAHEGRNARAVARAAKQSPPSSTPRSEGSGGRLRRDRAGSSGSAVAARDGEIPAPPVGRSSTSQPVRRLRAGSGRLGVEAAEQRRDQLLSGGGPRSASPSSTSSPASSFSSLTDLQLEPAAADGVEEEEEEGERPGRQRQGSASSSAGGSDSPRSESWPDAFPVEDETAAHPAADTEDSLAALGHEGGVGGVLPAWGEEEEVEVEAALQRTSSEVLEAGIGPGERVVLRTSCDQVTPLRAEPGTLYVTASAMLFATDPGKAEAEAEDEAAAKLAAEVGSPTPLSPWSAREAAQAWRTDAAATAGLIPGGGGPVSGPASASRAEVRAARAVCGGDWAPLAHSHLSWLDDAELLASLTRARRWSLAGLREIQPRRYVLQPRALEFFFVDAGSVFFAFADEDTRKRVCRAMSCQRTPSLEFARTLSPQRILLLGEWTKRWQRREISNFEYLMRLNTVAGRSYNDLAQYPVMPWVLADYSSEQLRLREAETYRDLRLPMGALDPERLEGFLARYETMRDGPIAPFLFGSHYSSAGVVVHFLVRVEPFASRHVRFQGTSFDNPDRLFISLGDSWTSARSGQGDVRELVPELFVDPDTLRNADRLPLGERMEGRGAVDNVRLPPWARSPEHFVRVHRDVLESEHVTRALPHWIDLVFGYKQRGAEAERAHNVFHPLSYEGADPAEAGLPDDPRVIRAHILNFGQTPSQLFSRPHPPRDPQRSCPLPLPLAVASPSAHRRRAGREAIRVSCVSGQLWGAGHVPEVSGAPEFGEGHPSQAARRYSVAPSARTGARAWGLAPPRGDREARAFPVRDAPPPQGVRLRRAEPGATPADRGRTAQEWHRGASESGARWTPGLPPARALAGHEAHASPDGPSPPFHAWWDETEALAASDAPAGGGGAAGTAGGGGGGSSGIGSSLLSRLWGRRSDGQGGGGGEGEGAGGGALRAGAGEEGPSRTGTQVPAGARGAAPKQAVRPSGDALGPEARGGAGGGAADGVSTWQTAVPGPAVDEARVLLCNTRHSAIVHVEFAGDTVVSVDVAGVARITKWPSLSAAEREEDHQPLGVKLERVVSVPVPPAGALATVRGRSPRGPPFPSAPLGPSLTPDPSPFRPGPRRRTRSRGSRSATRCRAPARWQGRWLSAPAGGPAR